MLKFLAFASKKILPILIFLLILHSTADVRAEMANIQPSEYYLSRCIWKYDESEVLVSPISMVAILNFNQDKTIVRRIAFTQYNSNLKRPEEQEYWYVQGVEFPHFQSDRSPELKLIAKSEAWSLGQLKFSAEWLAFHHAA